MAISVKDRYIQDLEQRVLQLEEKLDKLTDASKAHFLIYKEQIIDSAPGNPYIPGRIRQSFNNTYELFGSITQATKTQSDNGNSK